MNNSEFEVLFQEIKTLISEKMTNLRQNTSCAAAFGVDMNKEIIIKTMIEEHYPELENELLNDIITLIIFELKL